MQSKIESHIESSMNIISGFILSLLVWLLVVGPLILNNILSPTSTVDAFIITGLFTITSYLRSYIWRRLFNGGIYAKIQKVLKEHYNITLGRDAQVVGDKQHKGVKVWRNNKVCDHRGSVVEAYEDNVVEAYKDSIVYAYKDSRVHAYKGSRVYAYEGSIVYAYEDSSIVADVDSNIVALGGKITYRSSI